MRVNKLWTIGVFVAFGMSVAGCAGRDGGMESRQGHAEEMGLDAETLLSEQRVPEAMMAADEVISSLGADNATKGRAYMVMSLCHTAAHNSVSALAFAEMALDCCPDDEEAQGIYADALTDAHRYRECVEFLDSRPAGQAALRRRAIPALTGMGEWQRVITLTDSIGIDELSDRELLFRAYSLARLGRLNSGSQELRLLDLDDRSRSYSREELRLLADIYGAKGDRQLADETAQRLTSMQDSLIASLSESKIYEDLYTLEHSRRREEELRARRSEMRLFMAVGAGVVLASLLLVVILMMRLQSTRRRADSERQLLMLREELKHRHEENRAKETSLAEMSSRVDRLFRDHYEAIEMAANLLLDASLSKNSEKKIADPLSGIVDGCREPKFLRSLEQTVNLYRSNVINRLRAQLPDLSESDMTIILYAAGGLTPRVMCLLTGLSASALYNRKYRLKKRIAASDAADAKEFIQLLGQ